MKTAAVLKALAVSALVLALVSAAQASCGCSGSGKDVCGMGRGCSSSVQVRPAKIIPVPRPTTVVRKYVTTVVEESQPETPSCYAAVRAAPVARPAPQPCYQPAPAPAPAPEPCSSCGRRYTSVPQQRTVVYEEAPAPVVVVRPAPQKLCRSCLLPARSCGCQ